MGAKKIYLQQFHTKTGQIGQNRDYGININEYRTIIDEKKNSSIEDMVNALTFVIKTTETGPNVGTLDVTLVEGCTGYHPLEKNGLLGSDYSFHASTVSTYSTMAVGIFFFILIVFMIAFFLTKN
jgi:hypothetical protein